jgi:hypothetical protein
MRESIAILMILGVVLAGNLAWGDELTLQEAYLGGYDRSTPKGKSLSKKNGERFQAARVNDLIVLILDTQEGHLWTWSIKTINGEGPELKYQGQVTSCVKR